MALSQKPSTRFKVDDNSGAKEAEFIGFPGNSRVRRQLKVGDIIKVTVKKALPNGNIKPGQMFYAVISRTKQWLARADGTQVQADTNGVVLLDNKREAPIGTRVLSIVAREIAEQFPAISSLAVGIY